jgi:hypothetical protein
VLHHSGVDRISKGDNRFRQDTASGEKLTQGYQISCAHAHRLRTKDKAEFQRISPIFKNATRRTSTNLLDPRLLSGSSRSTDQRVCPRPGNHFVVLPIGNDRFHTASVLCSLRGNENDCEAPLSDVRFKNWGDTPYDQKCRPVSCDSVETG